MIITNTIQYFRCGYSHHQYGTQWVAPDNRDAPPSARPQGQPSRRRRNRVAESEVSLLKRMSWHQNFVELLDVFKSHSGAQPRPYRPLSEQMACLTHCPALSASVSVLTGCVPGPLLLVMVSSFQARATRPSSASSWSCATWTFERLPGCASSPRSTSGK